MGSSAGQKRITKELGECTQEPPPGTKIELADGSSLYTWNIYMNGPEQSPYEGGVFQLVLKLPTDYPFKPPQLNFATKIYHPNVSNDDKGSMCLGMLRSDQWKPPNRIHAILEMVRNILIEPNTEEAVETAIADQYKNNRAEYEKVAKDWTKKHARKS